MPVEENTLEEKLAMIKEKAGLIITNKSQTGLIYFTIENSLNQPFKQGISVLFNGITGDEQFYINLHANNLKQKEIEEFAVEFNRASSIVRMLNEEINKMKNTILH